MSVERIYKFRATCGKCRKEVDFETLDEDGGLPEGWEHVPAYYEARGYELCGDCVRAMERRGR